MGQYFMVANYDKKQFLHPHKFGDGLKAIEFIGNRGTMGALGFLLANPLNQSSDFSLPDDDDSRALQGSWAGNRIEILGDYHDKNHPVDYSTISQELDGWEDISVLMWNIVEANSWGEWKPPAADRRYWEKKEQEKPDTPDIKTIKETNSENWRT